MSTNLHELSTETLHAMHGQIQRWIIGLFVVDALAVVVFVVVLINRPGMNVVPFIPLLILPGLVLTPFLLRLTAIKKELESRGAGGKRGSAG